MKRRTLEIIMGILLLAAVATNAGYVSTKDAKLSRKVIVIDAGHGGADPGKVSKDNVLEKDINLAIAKMLKDMLEEEGYSVVMTRNSDAGLYSENDTNKKVADMKARCKLIEDSKAELVVSIHQNSYQSSNINGAQVFYYKHSPSGQKLAKSIQKSLKENVNENNKRQAKYNDNYYLLLHTPCPTVIVECGFLSNPEETKLLTSRDYQESLAKAVTIGINEYMEEQDE